MDMTKAVDVQRSIYSKEHKVKDYYSRLSKSAELLGSNGGTLLDVGSYRCEIKSYLKGGWNVKTFDCVDGDYIGDFNERFPIEDCVFDAAFAGEVIEHTINPNHFLRECHRVLRKDGILVLTTPNLNWWRDRIRILIGKTSLNFSAIDHYHVFQFRELVSLLEETGFTVLKVKSSYLFFSQPKYPKILRDVGSKLADFLPTLSQNHIIKAKA